MMIHVSGQDASNPIIYILYVVERYFHKKENCINSVGVVEEAPPA